MGIKLDWDVESDDGWDEIAEDPAVVAARQQAGRRWLVAALSLLLIVGGLVGGGFWRLRLLESERRDELKVTVTAEITALRIGDQRAYLDLQAPIDWWREAQAANFQRYQQGEAVVGEIVGLDVDLDRGMATLREQRSEQPVLVTWFYQHSGAGWQHTAPTLEQWEEIQTASTVFDVRYRTIDEAYIKQLMPVLDAWWVEVQQLTFGVGAVPRPEIRLTSDPAVRWINSQEWILQIPSPQVRRRPADGSLDTPFMGQIADAFAGRWAAESVGTSINPFPESDSPWYQVELARWLRYKFAPDYPSALYPLHSLAYPSSEPSLPAGSAFLNPLTETYGNEVIPRLTQAVRANDRIIPALEIATGESVTTLPVTWNDYFTSRLQAEASLAQRGAVAEVDRLYRDPDRWQRLDGRVSDYAVERAAQIQTIQVTKTVPLNDLLLAEVHFAVQDWPAQPPVEYLTYEPFRIVNGRWVHTWLVADDWGEIQTHETEHFLIQYQALDAPSGEKLADEMETLYARLIHLLQLGPDRQPERVLLVITPLRDEFATSGDLFVRYRNDPWIVVTSPFAAVRLADQTAWESIYQSATSQMAAVLVGQKVAPLDVQQPIAAAFADWAVGQKADARFGGTPASSVPFGTTQEVSIVSLWPDELERAGQVQRHYDPIDYVAAEALVKVLVDAYGEEAIPALLAGLPKAASLDEWLAVSIGGSASDIAPAWRQQFDAMGTQP